jgi:hypothetical protein
MAFHATLRIEHCTQTIAGRKHLLEHGFALLKPDQLRWCQTINW